MEKKNIAKVIIEVPSKYNTPAKIEEYLKNKGLTATFARWVYNSEEWEKK